MIAPQRRPVSRRRRRRTLPRLAIAAAIAASFAVGLGLGEALRDTPGRGTQTLIRTLRPLSLVPFVRETVTVTTTTP